MTQQQYQQPQYQQPQYPQQGYPPAPPPQQYQQPQYPQAPPAQYPQQPYPQQYAPAPPAPPLADGSLDDFYNQPSAGGGPGISWQDKAGNKKPLGTTYAGVVARDVTNGDVQQQTNPQGVPQTFRDGRPKFQMKVPLKSVMIGDGQGSFQPSPEFPDGEAAWYVRGQARDELTRAMAEAGCDGAPKTGATVIVTLVQRRQSGAGFQPANIVQVRYVPPNGQPHQEVQQQAPATGAASPVPEAPSQPATQPPADPGQPPQWAQAAPPNQGQQQYPPAPQQVGQQGFQQPQGPQQGAPQPPADLSPEQQQLLAQLTGGQG